MPALIGNSLKRREDPRLITGSATYTDDIQLPRMLYAAVLRSPWAHARVSGIDVGRARTSPGVVAVYTGRDLAERVNPVPCAWMVPNCELKVPPHPLLAVDTVRYVGDGVAFVVAESREAARDALDLIDVDYYPLGAVVDPEQATLPTAGVVAGDGGARLDRRWEQPLVDDAQIHRDGRCRERGIGVAAGDRPGERDV